jgi:hypothetical protein
VEPLPRRATDPSRGFEPTRLDDLPSDDRRALVLAVLAHRGIELIELRPRAGWDELLVGVNTGLRQREAVVRVHYDAIEQSDLDDATALAESGQYADVTVIHASAAARGQPADVVSFVGPESLVEAIEASPLVRWNDGSPSIDREERTLVRHLQQTRWVESDAFSWLPVVARNKVPYGLDVVGATPDALFERAVFRVLTHVLRFSGRRLGEAQRGAAEPDALLTLPGNPTAAALLDTKAARDGYRMARDDQRALTEYVEHYKPALAEQGISLEWVLMVSSAFPGGEGTGHPFHARAEALRTAGVQLVYLTAGDLATLAAQCEIDDVSPEERVGWDWATVLSRGQLTLDMLEQLRQCGEEA